MGRDKKHHNFIKKLSLRYQFTLIVFAVSAIILIISHLVFVGLQIQEIQDRILRQMEVQGEIIAYNCRSSLDFRDAVDAEVVLRSLSFRESILAACLYDERKRIFASYRANEDVTLPEVPGEPGFYNEDGSFFGYIRITNGEQELGVLYLLSDNRELVTYFNKTVYLAIFILFIAVILAYGLSVYSQKFLSRPFLDISSAAQQIIKGGNYDARISTPFSNEIGQFAENFNFIFSQLEQSQSNLRESEERFRSYFELGIVGMAVVDPELKWIVLNKMMSKILVGDDTLPGKNWLEFTHPDDREKEKFMLDELIKGREDQYQLKKRYIVGTNKLLHVVQSVRIVRDSAGNPKYLLLMVEDVSEEHKLDSERSELIKELKSKNTELESFTYTVSHDLRGPLVTIRGFLHLLEEGMIKGGVDEIKEFIDRIKTSVLRMEDLLEDLLKLSRVGRIAEMTDNVSMTDLAQQAKEMINGKIIESKATVNIAKLPVVHGDKSRLYQVWQNLMENALKFTREGVDPVINIGVEENSDNEEVYYVQDNGIGIDPNYRDHVFSLFKRLNTKVDGTGVGLTLVRRIIEVHGGRIWVSDNPDGHGTRFSFTIADKNPELKDINE